jgi:acyl-CoA dehydrogenase
VNFNLPEELQMLKDNLRRFVDTELIPIERETMDGNEMKPGMQAMLEEKAKGLGLWMFDVPEEFGGLGLGALAKAVMWE